jgi:hypothetical protein
MAPGHTHVLGGENPGQAQTLIRFTDGSMLRVHWDGRYEVAGKDGMNNAVTVYCPRVQGEGSRRLIFPWHRIDMIEHTEREDDA